MLNVEESISNSKKLKLLYVEDSKDAREATVEFLEEFFDDIVVAVDGEDGVEKFQENNIDLVITDINMPKMTGLGLSKKIKELNNDIPILILSAYSDMTYFMESIKLGIDGYIIKPIEFNQFLSVLDKILSKLESKHEVSKNLNLLNQYKNTIDRSSIISKADARGFITFVNNKFCEISGYSREELLGKPHNIVRHPDENSNIYKDLWHTIKDLKKPWMGEIKNQKKDGSTYWVKTIINPIFDEVGDLVEYIGIRTDITEQVQLKLFFEKKLNTTSKNLTQAVKLSHEYELAIDEGNILSRMDLHGKITFVNDKFCELSGYSRTELIGQTHSILRHEDVPKEMFKELWQRISSGTTWHGILKRKTKRGLPYWVDATIMPIMDAKNNILEYMSIKHDVTEIFDLHKEIEETQREVIYRMGEIGETRSLETGNHVKRVAQYSKDLALLYGLSIEESEMLFTASPMHDIGKVGIADKILKKPGKLTESEFKVMKTHAKLGYNVLKGSDRTVLKTAAIVALEHHEKWDGSGYPKGLSGEDIHIYGRITAVADVFDALGSERCYKDAWEDERIFELFRNERAKHFDPELVDIFFDNIDVFLNTRAMYRD